MARVRIVHWKAAEAERLIAACRAGRFEVDYDDLPFPELVRLVAANPPNAIIIDLTRLPSHGREMGAAFRRAKQTRHIPIVFVDGAPEKIERIRLELPDATFAVSSNPRQFRAQIRSACASTIPNPVIPGSPMERYRSRTAVQKLGINPGLTVAVIDAPRDYATALGELPEGVELIEDPADVHAVTLWFVRDPRTWQAGLRRMKSIADRTKLWVLWPKGNRDGITQFLIRNSANEVGLVDYKICAVNQQWSGMALARRKS